MKYLNVATRAFNTPLLIQQSKANVISEYLIGRMNSDDDISEDSVNDLPDDIVDGNLMSVTDAGIAVINMHGTLVQRGGYMDASSGMLSYQILREQMEFALDDSQIKGIIINTDSGGGEVSGAFDLGDFIYEARGIKPIYAIADELMASAAYLTSSAADKVFVPRTGFIGSVGVLVTHFDYSKQLENEGVKVTQIFAGDRKIDGSPYSPLTDEALASLQDDITEIYGMFTQVVSRNRAMDVSRVVGTQASTFMGQKAVDVGFADSVGNFDNIIQSMIGSVTTSRATIGLSMKNSKKESITASEENDAVIEDVTTDDSILDEHVADDVTDSHLDSVVEDEVEDDEDDQQLEELSNVAKISERQRIRDITTSEAAQGNSSLAEHLAYNTDMSVEEAVQVLEASQPKGNQASSFKDKMKGEKTPNVTVDKPAKKYTSKRSQRMAAIAQSQNKGAK